MNLLNETIELLEFLDSEIKFIEANRNSTDECGTFLHYEIIDDYEISIETGFTDYEEGSYITINLKFEQNRIICSIVGGGHSCSGGNWALNETKEFSSVNEFIKYAENNL